MTERERGQGAKAALQRYDCAGCGTAFLSRFPVLGADRRFAYCCIECHDESRGIERDQLAGFTAVDVRNFLEPSRKKQEPEDDD